MNSKVTSIQPQIACGVTKRSQNITESLNIIEYKYKNTENLPQLQTLKDRYHQVAYHEL